MSDTNFREGDRVYRTTRGTDYFGTVIGLLSDAVQVAWDHDDESERIWVHSPHYLRLVEPEPISVPGRAGQVSEEFRAKPENRRWETSYTKRIHDMVGTITQGVRMTDAQFTGLLQAYDLLKDYHDTQHVVYEQRDEARRERDGALISKAFWIDYYRKAARGACEKLSAIKKLVR